MEAGKKIRTLVLIVFVGYFLLLVKFILFKNIAFIFGGYYSKNYNGHLLKLSWERANFIPGKTLYYYLSLQEKFETGLENLGGNILLFIPYGFLLPIAFRKCREFAKLLFVVILTSSFFEICQLFLAYGNCDIDDVILNGLGGIIGYWIFCAIIFYTSE